MKNAVSKKTERILMRILKWMEAEKDRIDMGQWGYFHDGKEDFYDSISGANRKVPPCGTTACLAGTCLLVTKEGRSFLKEKGYFSKVKANIESQFPWGSAEMAKEILELDDIQRKNLFYFYDMRHDGYGWPTKYSDMYKAAKSSAGRFKAVKLRVLHFIKTGE